MSIFSYRALLCLRNIFIWFFVVSLELTASVPAEPKEIQLSGTGAALSQSVLSGFQVLQSRDDHIALILKKCHLVM